MAAAFSRLGWIIDAQGDGTRLVRRDQRALFEISCEPVFEIWLWHPRVRCYFVMSHEVRTDLEKQGVFFFSPDDVPQGLVLRACALEGLRNG